MKILDIGSGATPKLTSTYDGIDITYADRRPFPDFEHVDRQDMENLDYEDNSFDIVICINALDHTPDAIMAVQEMQRVARYMVYIDCALIQRTQSGGHHYWDALENGTLINRDGIVCNLPLAGFEVELIDNGGERRYNHIHAVYNHP